MAVQPTHRILNGDMQVIERVVIRHLKPPPDRRIRLQEGDLELQDVVIGPSAGPCDRDLKRSLDLAFMVWTYHFFKKPVAMLKSLIPALKPGARADLAELGFDGLGGIAVSGIVGGLYF